MASAEEAAKEKFSDHVLGPPVGPIYRPAKAAAYLGLSISTFYEGVKAGTLPPLIKVGARASGIPKPWLDAYLVGRARAHA